MTNHHAMFRHGCTHLLPVRTHSPQLRVRHAPLRHACHILDTATYAPHRAPGCVSAGLPCTCLLLFARSLGLFGLGLRRVAARIVQDIAICESTSHRRPRTSAGVCSHCTGVVKGRGWSGRDGRVRARTEHAIRAERLVMMSSASGASKVVEESWACECCGER